MTAFIIDVTIVGIVAFCTWRGFKNGFIRGVFGIVSLIAALMIANVAAQAYSNDAKTVLEPFVSGVIESTLTDMNEHDIEYQSIAHDHEDSDEEFGKAYTVLRQIGFPEAAAVNIAQQAGEALETAEEGLMSFVDALADKLTSTLSYVAVLGIAFLILAIAFAVVGNLLGFVFSLPGLKLLDTIAGSIFGFAKGLLLVFILAVIVRYFGILALSLIEETTVLQYLINNNPIATMLGL